MSKLLPKTWENASEEQRQKMASEITPKGWSRLPEGHIAFTYKPKTNASVSTTPNLKPTSNSKNILNALADKPSDSEGQNLDVKVLLETIPRNNPLKQLWQKPLNETEQESFKNELREYIKVREQFWFKVAKKENPESPNQEIEDKVVDNLMEPILKGQCLGEIATNGDDFQSSLSIVARRKLYSMYSDQIRNEKLKEQFTEATNWLLKYETSYIGGNYLTQTHLENMVKVALPYIIKNQDKIRNVKPEFKGKTGYYGLVITPKNGNKVIVKGSGNVQNLSSEKYQGSGQIYSATPLTEMNIVLKTSEK